MVLGDTVEVSEFRHKNDILQRMSKNLTAAHIKACANKIAFLYESLDRTFKEMT